MAFPVFVLRRQLLLLPLLLLLLLCTTSRCNEVSEEVHMACGLHGWIESPGYPGPYPVLAVHEWHITVPPGYTARLQFVHFDVETSVNCQYDFVKVSAGNETLGLFCGQASKDAGFMPGNRLIEAPGNSINVTLSSDFSNEERFTGFKAYFTALDVDECERYAGVDDLACQHHCHNYPGGFDCSCRYGYILDEDQHTCTVECSGQEFTEREGVLTSPEYPRPYPKALQCKYTLRLEEGFVFNLAFQETFDVERYKDVDTCPYDSLTIVSGAHQWGPLCGSQLPGPMETTGSVVEIIFTSDKSGDHTGWKIRYTSKGISCPPVVVPNDGSVIPKQESYSFKDRIAVSCSTGYRLIQSENGIETHALEITCRSNGTWDRMFPTCQIVDCKLPELPLHSTFHVKGDTTQYKENALFKCIEAYEFTTHTDNAAFTCNESGRWTNPRYGETFPTCQPVCGQPKNVIEEYLRVIGGKRAASGNFPWQGMVRKYSPVGQVIGGGSLLNERWVVTAAHVVEKLLPDQTFIILGAVWQRDTKSVQVYKVDEIFHHPGYNSSDSYDNDIALLRLAGEPVKMTDTVRPICLPTGTGGAVIPALTTGELGYVSGWGVVQTQLGSAGSQSLQYVELPVVEHSTCVESNHNKFLRGEGTYSKLTENMFCAGYPGGGRDACQGDSGGSFSGVHEDKWYLMGIVSWGISCAQANQYGIYTRVDKYLDWLHSEVAKHS